MPELWGGHECTINRVGAQYGDQTRATGHSLRADDLDRFAELGIAALRYPVLWEHVAPEDPEILDWRWTDARLARLRALAIRPIVGLVHHGSGPHYTDLLDPGFAPGLARFAGAVATRYPWVRDWTPVNEPLTTARFSTLYGHWYPHQRDENAFWLALLNQIDGVRLSMREIRRVNPEARLIQTDDLGRTWATVPLRHQAAFDNVRRWMGWDLLCGKVMHGHPLWERLVAAGFGDRLRALLDDPCPPDVIGVNHYLTSDRFLDHRLQRYPPDAAGGNADQRFADVAAVRVLEPYAPGLDRALREAWERYGIPVAATEVHNGCTREEQMRWMHDAWQTAIDLRGAGVAVEAVTNWALLGNQGWDTLLTAPGRYEAGAFDVRGPAPRATALARMLPALRAGLPVHVTASTAGWWRRPVRLLHSAVPHPAPMREILHASPGPEGRIRAPLLICGATGTLGQALARACAHRDIAYVLADRATLDLLDPASIGRALDRHRPWAVVNAAGWVRVDDAEQDPDACILANAEGAARLARMCQERGISSVSFSSDLVFDGGQREPNLETDTPRPLNVYGRSKVEAERAITALSGNHLIIRTAAFFSPYDRHNFATRLIETLAAGQRFDASDDEIISPTYVPHLCDTTLDLLIDAASGIWHLSNHAPLSWFAFAQQLAARCGMDSTLVQKSEPARPAAPATRPAYAALGTSRGVLLPSLDEAIDHFSWNIPPMPGALRERGREMALRLS